MCAPSDRSVRKARTVASKKYEEVLSVRLGPDVWFRHSVVSTVLTFATRVGETIEDAEASFGPVARNVRTQET